MSEWTWSLYRADVLPKEELNAWLDKKIAEIKSQYKTYEQYAEFYKSNREYLLKIGYTENQIEQMSSKETYKKEIAKNRRCRLALEKVRDGRKPVKSLSTNIYFLDLIEDDDPHVEVYPTAREDDVLFINPTGKEIFRCRVYTEEDFDEVDRLIEFLHEQDGKKLILDFSKENLEYEDLTPELESRIREHYGRYGDGNFNVSFG